MSPMNTLAAMLQTLQSHGPTRTERDTVDAMNWSLERISRPRADIADQLVSAIAEGIAALRLPCYGGVQVTDEQAEERARNITQQLLLTYEINPKEE